MAFGSASRKCYVSAETRLRVSGRLGILPLLTDEILACGGQIGSVCVAVLRTHRRKHFGGSGKPGAIHFIERLPNKRKWLLEPISKNHRR